MVRQSLGLVLAAVVVGAVSAQQTPVFRGGTDAVTVDVVVLDKSGAPVRTLKLDDFTVVAGKKPRRIIAADYVNAVSVRRTEMAKSTPAASSNTRMSSGRTLVIVADVANMLAGAGRASFKTIADYLDKLGPDDRVGVLPLPTGKPIEPSTDRAAVKEALLRLIGTSARLRLKEMTFGEAAAIQTGDLKALDEYFRRVADQGQAPGGINKLCEPVPNALEKFLRVPRECIDEAERVIERTRFETRTVLSRLGSLAEAMTPIPGPKSIILLSGAALVDPETVVALGQFGASAEKSRVSLYALLLQPMPGEAADATGPTTETRRLDGQLALNGLGGVAAAARGRVEEVYGDATTAMARIDRETSGYYLLSFEQDPADREGARVSIDVKVRGEGLTVMSRKEFTATRAAVSAPPAELPKDFKAAIGGMLKTAAPLAQVAVDIDAFVLPANATGGDGRAILAIEVGADAAKTAAFGFQVADARGKVVADGFDAPAKVQARDDGRSLFVTQIPVTTGKFIVRVAVIDAQGQSGFGQHVFEVKPWGDGPIRLSDVFFGDTLLGEFRPAARLMPGAGLAARIVIRDQTQKFEGIKAKAIITRATDDSVVDSADVPLVATPDPVRRFVDIEVPVRSYANGEYVVTMVVTEKDKEIGSRSRAFVK